jgi:hypothetical protein
MPRFKLFATYIPNTTAQVRMRCFAYEFGWRPVPVALSGSTNRASNTHLYWLYLPLAIACGIKLKSADERAG